AKSGAVARALEAGTKSRRAARCQVGLRAFALLLAAGCSAAPGEQVTTGTPGVGGSSTTTLPMSAGADASTTRRLRRLSAREYDNVARDLLGDTSAPAKSFIPDAFQNGYDNGSVGLAIQSDQVVSYQAAAEALAASAVHDRLEQLLEGCAVAERGEGPCADAFLNSFVPRAFRRPPTATELGRLRKVYEKASAAAGFETGIQTALEAILQSPQFLYREELGPIEAELSSPQAVRLTDYEVASELSFLLTGSSPDDALWSAVSLGHFQSSDDYLREATRLLASPGARDTLRAFLQQWLATDRLASLTKDAGVYPSFSAELATSMSTELDRFFDDVLWHGSGSLRELFTSSQSFVDPNLGQLYGVATSDSGFQPVALDPQLRQGVLSRAGFLAAHAATDSSGPISRGVFVLQALLCAPPPTPPPNVPPAAPVGDPVVKDLTTRQRFEQHVSTPFCAACHQMIDGVGFGFEQFDGIGAYRTTEKGKPVDSSGQLVGTGEIDGAYSGVSELSQKLAGSQHLRDCFVKQVYRFAMGQVEPSEGSQASLNALGKDFDSDERLLKVLLSLVQSPLFVTRTFEPASSGSQP
ncbi:MAG TPA: DUF1592 domain-containing protein, partial [Polyangiaceae bacterium]|nr:DUF1592 domain-containing protein [Polyangiaceae bacterium]